jgi:hypothetical protein
MPMPKKWFSSNERREAKMSAKHQNEYKEDVQVWKFTRTTRNGKTRGFYVGTYVPVVLQRKNIALEEIDYR